MDRTALAGMTSPELLRQDAERYRKLLSLGIPDEKAEAALHELIAKCEADAEALEAAAKAPPET